MDNLCVCCGETIPEGRQVCPRCDKAGNMRNNNVSWDTYFMGVAMLASQRSKDPNTQVGACIVNEDNIIVGVGYNGMPRSCLDNLMPWGRDDPNELNTKYPYVCHAELNAILNSTGCIKNCTLYVTLFPCNECAKAIMQSGITRIIYLEDKYPDSTGVKASKLLFKAGHVRYDQYEKCNDSIVLDL